MLYKTEVRFPLYASLSDGYRLRVMCELHTHLNGKQCAQMTESNRNENLYRAGKALC